MWCQKTNAGLFGTTPCIFSTAVVMICFWHQCAHQQQNGSSHSVVSPSCWRIYTHKFPTERTSTCKSSYLVCDPVSVPHYKQNQICWGLMHLASLLPCLYLVLLYNHNCLCPAHSGLSWDEAVFVSQAFWGSVACGPFGGLQLHLCLSLGLAAYGPFVGLVGLSHVGLVGRKVWGC